MIRTITEEIEGHGTCKSYSEPVLQQRGTVNDGARFTNEWEDVPIVVIEE